MRRTAQVLAVAVFIGWAVGCGGGAGRDEKLARKYGEPIVSHNQGDTPVMAKAPFDGPYALFQVRPDGKPLSAAAYLGPFNLKEGDPIGFKASDVSDQAVIAVAGDKTKSIPNKGYRWLYRAGR